MFLQIISACCLACTYKAEWHDWLKQTYIDLIENANMTTAFFTQASCRPHSIYIGSPIRDRSMAMSRVPTPFQKATYAISYMD